MFRYKLTKIRLGAGISVPQKTVSARQM